MDNNAIRVGIISVGAIGVMRSIEEFPVITSIYQKYALILLIAFLALIIFSKRISEAF